MKALSSVLNSELIENLRGKIQEGFFPEVKFQDAMEFILNDGIFPKSDLPAASFIKLQNWLQSEGRKQVLTYTATELKNKTGEILDQVLRGRTVQLIKHGRPIAEIKKLEE
jgi:prevent-host-death family protein